MAKAGKRKRGVKSKKKTQKSISKRVQYTKKGSKKKGKLRVRRAGQDHFNARESGRTMRNKRRDRSPSKTIQRNIKRLT